MDLIEELDLKVIDTDTHVVEDYDLWTSRISVAKYGDLVPHVVRENGVDLWVTGGRVLNKAAWAAAAGWSEAPPNNPRTLDGVDPRVYRAEDRLKLMDEYGIYAQVLYPNVSGFGAGRFAEVGDPEFRYLLLKAYNDYLADFASVDPKRYIPVMALPFWDIDMCIREMERCVPLGHRGVIFSQDPSGYGEPRLSDPHWDRLWAAAQEMELPINFHIGSGTGNSVDLLAPQAGPAANYAVMPVTFFVSNTATISQLIGGGICHRFPNLHFVSVESGIGWIPFVLQALEWMWDECQVTAEHPEYDLRPTEYFQRQIHGCFWFEHGDSLQHALNHVGADSILYETDFPHSCSMAPGPASCALSPRDFISQRLSDVAPDVLRKVLHDNAAKLYKVE